MTEKKYLNRNSIETVCLFIFLIILTFLFLTISPLHIWKGTDVGNDSGVFMTVAMMMDKGYMPYRDTFDHKGPLIYFINYVGRQISAYRGVWVIEFVSMFATFLFIYKIARLKCGKVLSCIVLLISTSLLFDYFDNGNLVEEYAMPFIAVALYIFLDYLMNRNVSKLRLIFCGLCFGGVCMLRPNMISVWVVFCVAIIVKSITDKKLNDLGMFIILFTLGFALIVLSNILWLAINNGLADFWYEYINFNFVYSTSNIVGRWRAFFTFCNNPIIILAFIVSAYMIYRPGERILYVICCCYLFITLLSICMPGLPYSHYGMILVPAVAFPIASLFDLCVRSFSADKGKIGAFLIALYFLYTLIMPDWLPVMGDLAKIYSMRREENNSVLVNTVCRVVDDNTQADDKISVYGNWDIIYLLSDRAHATKYSYQFPIGNKVPDIMDDYFDELEEQLPVIIVIEKGRYDDRMASFLDSNDYSLVWSEPDTEQQTLVYCYN